ncbi:MAG: hypothetical protein KDE47_21345 [Caldilineaceae bacterium]|nr:hypothetical protein [Caldilineaceae bacterium]
MQFRKMSRVVRELHLAKVREMLAQQAPLSTEQRTYVNRLQTKLGVRNG